MITTYSNTLVREALISAVRGTGTVNGPGVDTNAFGNACRDVLFIISTSTITDGSHAITVEESDVVGSGYTAVAAAQTLGSLPTIVAADDDTFFAFGVRNTKRFVRLVLTITAGATGGNYSAKAVLGNGSNRPATRS